MNNLNTNNNINEIVKGPDMPLPCPKIPGLPPGLVATHEITYVTVDSGACDNIIPPHIFKNGGWPDFIPITSIIRMGLPVFMVIMTTMMIKKGWWI